MSCAFLVVLILDQFSLNLLPFFHINTGFSSDVVIDCKVFPFTIMFQINIYIHT